MAISNMGCSVFPTIETFITCRANMLKKFTGFEFYVNFTLTGVVRPLSDSPGPGLKMMFGESNCSEFSDRSTG